MRKLIANILGAALLFQAPAFAAQDETPRQPSGKWTVDFAETQCVAILPFGDKDDTEMLLIKPIPTGKHVQIAMVVDGGKRFALERTGEIRINGTKRDAQLLHYGTSARKQVYRFMVPGTIDAFDELERIEMILPRRKGYDLAVPQMDRVSAALDDCLKNLRTYWNMEGDTIAEGPQGDPSTVFTHNDYPAQALKEEQSGIAQAFMLIDEKGKVADCTISAFAGNIILAAQTCALITERLEMTPAVNAEGQAVRSTLMAPPVRWVIVGGGDMADLQTEFDRLTDAAGDCLEFGGTC